jgi:hypothetical protein
MLKNNTAKRNKMTFETTIKEIEINGRPEYEIRFINSEFSDLSFKYGEVKFNEDNKQESATLSFEYNIIDGEKPGADRLPAFEKMLGDYLVHLITEQISTRELVFKGGTSEE